MLYFDTILARIKWGLLSWIKVLWGSISFPFPTGHCWGTFAKGVHRRGNLQTVVTVDQLTVVMTRWCHAVHAWITSVSLSCHRKASSYKL